ncbi:MAG: ankyrin repeat domain-containing protein [Paracoccaceae bacterium]
MKPRELHQHHQFYRGIRRYPQTRASCLYGFAPYGAQDAGFLAWPSRKSTRQRECGDAITGLTPSLAIPIITLLLDAGADINAPGTLDVTPLHTAAGFGVSLELIQFLLDRGANPLAKDSDHSCDTPLGYVNKRKAPMLAALLMKHMERGRKTVP